MREALHALLRLVQAYVVAGITSLGALRVGQGVARVAGLRSADGVELFFCASDPHSLLALQAARSLLERFSIRVRLCPVGEPAEAGLVAYATSPSLQAQWRLADSRLLSRLYASGSEGSRLPECASARAVAPISAEVAARGHALCVALLLGGGGGGKDAHATARLVGLAQMGLVDALVEVSRLTIEGDLKGLAALERGCEREQAAPLPSQGRVEQVLKGNARELTRKGHYLSAMFRFGFEWYWGVDRVEFLERELADLGLARAGAVARPLFTRTTELRFAGAPARARVGAAAALPPVRLYWSFRSPYSQLVLRPLFAMCEHYGCELQLRPILPMVMRGLPVPMAKQLYIARDTARCARALGWHDYGFLNDPLGKPTENAFALYMRALELHKERQFLLAWSECVYARGEDMHTTAGLRALCAKAGFAFDEALLAEDRAGPWRAMAEKNRQDMSALGLWGVPSMTCGPIAVWGQDRLFAIEQALLDADAITPCPS